MRHPRIDHLLHINSRHFTWDKKTGAGSCEESDLKGRNIGLDDLMRQVYPDAADAGFVIVSERTQEKQLFFYHHTEKEGQEIKWWEFWSYDGYAETGKYKVFIWND